MSGTDPAATPADERFPCPFCGAEAHIATFWLDCQELYQPLCDSCGAPSYFVEDRSLAKNAWMK